MIQKKVSVKVKGETKEVDLLLPESIDEVVKMLKALPKRDLLKFVESKMKMMARLQLLNAGKPPKVKKRVMLKIDGLPPDILKRLKDEELI